MVHMLQLEVSNASRVQKERTVQTMDCEHMIFVLMGPILIQKAGVIVYLVMLATDVQVLE